MPGHIHNLLYCFAVMVCIHDLLCGVWIDRLNSTNLMITQLGLLLLLIREIRVMVLNEIFQKMPSL